MSKTIYVAAEKGIHFIVRGLEDWPIGIWGSSELNYESVAKMLNDAYQRGIKEKAEEIRKTLGI